MTKEEITQLVEAHWEYVKSVINNELPHEADASLSFNVPEYVERIGHHFKTAMTHGVKHGIEWANINHNKTGDDNV